MDAKPITGGGDFKALREPAAAPNSSAVTTTALAESSVTSSAITLDSTLTTVSTAPNNGKPEKQERPLQNVESTAGSKEAITASNTTTIVATGKGARHAGERKSSINFEERVKVESDLEITELLGSVTTHNCPGTRTSARVIQKMKQDQIRPTTPPNDRDNKKEEKADKLKTPSQLRANKPTWTNLERNHFFDALNEVSKDFEAIGNYINTKLKRKSATDSSFKTKDQVRQHYYQTYHKICKYIKFSDEIKKPAQELYALINYGEMRRKLQFVTDKHFMKLKNLVYQGHITVRCKGKNIRIKTPSCKALRRLNQLDDSLEDIRLPSKIEVIVSPANMESFGRVQTIAQNPRARTTVPLHKKLINFIKTFQIKWRSNEMRLAEEELKLFPPAATLQQTSMEPSSQFVEQTTQERSTLTPAYQDTEMCFLPKPGVTIHRPLLSITEYLSSVNICLTAYEERMGVKVRGEMLTQEQRHNSKRQRTESGSEKRSPDTKKHKQLCSISNDKLEIECGVATAGINYEVGTAIREDILTSQEPDIFKLKSESSGDELNDEMNELLAENFDSSKEESSGASIDVLKTENLSTNTNSNNNTTIVTTQTNTSATIPTSLPTPASVLSVVRPKRNATGAKSNARSSLTFKPLISDDVMRRIRKGWTVSNAADITIGDLYVVLGHDTKLELEYYWTDRPSVGTTAATTALSDNNTAPNTNIDTHTSTESSTPTLRIFSQKQNGMPYNPSECDDLNLLNNLTSSAVCNKLKHLLLIANLSERIRKRQCTCGHMCERTAARTRFERDLVAKTFISNKTFTSGGCGSPNLENNSVFRQPIVPIRRPMFSMDPVKQLNTLTRQKLSRQVLVQRLLTPSGGVGVGASGTTMGNHAYDLLHIKNLQNNFTDKQSQIEQLNMNHNNNNNYNSSNKTTSTMTTSESLCTTETTTSDSSTLKPTNNNATITAESSLNTFNLPLDEMKFDSMPLIPTATSEDNATSSTTATSTLLAPYSDIFHNTADQATYIGTLAEHTMPTSGSLPDSAFDDCSNTSIFNGMSPSHFLRESTTNSRWLEENLNDFSLTSLLGHLDEINSSRDILDPSSNLSVISESSVDYMHKFQEITALMQSQDKE